MQTQQLLQGNFRITILRYISLNVVSMIGLSLYILADTFFVANGVGSNGIVALNIALPAYSFVNGVGLLLGMGAATRFSIAIGEGQQERGSRIFTQAAGLGACATAVFTLIGICFSQPIVELLGASGEIIPLAKEYLQTTLCFSGAFIFNDLLICFVRNDKKPHLSTAAMLTASMSNILLDYIFVFPLGMGMFGAAFATGIAPLLSLCVLSTHFFKKHNHFRLVRCHPRWGEIRPLLLAGVPSFVNEFSSGVVLLLFNKIILALAGNTGVGAYGIITNIALVFLALFNGIGQGIQPLASLCYGAGEHKKIRQILRYGWGIAVVFGSLFYLSGLLFPEQMTAAFNKDGGMELTRIAVDGIRIYFIAFFMMGLNIVSASLFACVAQPRQAALLSVLRGFGAVIPLVLLLSSLFGLTGVWMTIPAAEALTLLLNFCFLAFYFRRKNVLPNR